VEIEGNFPVFNSGGSAMKFQLLEADADTQISHTRICARLNWFRLQLDRQANEADLGHQGTNIQGRFEHDSLADPGRRGGAHCTGHPALPERGVGVTHSLSHFKWRR